jgi:hypothetical protein
MDSNTNEYQEIIEMDLEINREESIELLIYSDQIQLNI